MSYEDTEFEGWDEPTTDELQEPSAPAVNPKSKPLRRLNPRQEDFCRIYVSNGFNATQAAHEAGYGDPLNPRSAQDDGSKLLARDYIQARVNELLSDSRKTYDVSRAELIQSAA